MSPAHTPSSDYAVRLSSLREATLTLWERTPASFPRLGTDAGPFRRWRNARSVAALFDHVAGQVLAYPDDGHARAAWRDELRGRVLRVGQDHLGWPPAYCRLLSSEAFYETAVSFARDARRFDPALPLEDLGQALRNVWVGNSLQMLVGEPVRLTPALFAYSMLYPATDNVLDDPALSYAAKRTFNERLARRLEGDDSSPENEAEEKPWSLVAILEGDCPRETCPHVWAAVLGIQQAQVASVRQQQDRSLAERDLLDLTMAKGGASVLADLYLVAPMVDSAAGAFAFRYGVFLQMLDDLQDIGPDLAAGHETLFTRAARQGHLDTLAGRLTAFIDVVLDTYRGAAHVPCDDTAELIRQNCRALVVGVMAREPGRFSRALRRRVGSQWPVGLRGMRRLIRHGHRQFEATHAQLQRARGTSSPLDLLLDDARGPQR
jgi:hypothetical protein